jgi:hypothetical protein
MGVGSTEFRPEKFVQPPSARNAGVISSATHMDVGSAEFCPEQIRATAKDGGSARNAGAISSADPCRS